MKRDRFWSNHIFAIIADAARRMSLLIDDLLRFSRMGRAELMVTRFSMNELVREVQAELAPDAVGRNVRWTVADLPEVTGDRALLKQVWINLLSNALKYSRTREVAEVEISCAKRDHEVEFQVRDNGVGFDMEFAGKLFGVFERLHSDAAFEGTGIGLANVRRIIHRHSGRTWAESQLDRGASFFFTLASS